MERSIFQQSPIFMRKLAFLAVLLLAACSVPRPYRMDIQQGNVVTQDMVAKLKPGMSKSQVRFVLGTPLVTDVFHANRWDYVYSMEKAGKRAEERRITVVFEGDQMKRVEGEAAPAPQATATSAPVPVEPAAQSKGLWDRIKEKTGF